MKKNLFIYNFNKYPKALLLIMAFVALAALFILRLPEESKDFLISQAYEEKRIISVKNQIQKLKNSNKDFSNYVFILGDSTTQAFEKELSNDAATDSLRKEQGIKFISFSIPAFTIVDYFSLTSAIAPLKPKAIVVCINLATFSPIYSNNPTYRFPEILALCEPELIERNMDALKEFYGLSQEEIRNYAKDKPENSLIALFMGMRQVIRHWITDNIETVILGRRTTEEMSNATKQAQLFLKTYQVNPNLLLNTHPYFVLSKEMYRICEREDVRLIFYITPFDVEFTKRVNIFDDIEVTVRHVKKQFLDIFPEETNIVYDFHDKLSEEDIVDTSGHLRKSGRKKVYKLLSEVLVKQ